MSTGRFVAPGRTRSCPHCKATILDSATVCPGCHHHLRFDSSSSQRAQTSDTPLRVDGILRHTADGAAWEYSIVLAIRNGRGEEISRQVVGVGALQPAEERTFSLAVEVFKPAESSRSVEVSKPAEAPKSAPAPGVPAPQPLAAAATATAGVATAGAITSAGVATAGAAARATPSPAAAAASSASVTRSPDPRSPDPRGTAPGRIVPPGFGPQGLGRDPARPQPGGPARSVGSGPPRSVGLKDPRLGASDPLHPKR